MAQDFDVPLATDGVRPERSGAAPIKTTVKVPTREEIVSRAKALAPKLRERAQQGEQLRRVPDETIADLKTAQFTRICQPSRYGGFDLGWDVLCEATLELARGDGSQAWACVVYGEHSCLVGHFPDEAQKDVWGDNKAALISSSFAPACRAERVDGGYTLTGKWGFSSGVHHADWTLVGALAPQPGGAVQHTFFLVPAADLTVVDDWHTLGLQGTGSCSFTLDKTFVPEHRVLSSKDLNEGNPPGAKVNRAPVFRMPVLGFAHTALCSVAVGIAEGLVEDFAAFLRGRHISGVQTAGLENQQTRLAESSAEVEAARLLLLGSARRFMARLEGGHTLTDDDARPTERDGTYAAILAKRAATRVFEATGARSLSLSSHMQRSFRDVFAAGSHVALNWDRAAVNYGRSVMGMPVGTIF